MKMTIEEAKAMVGTEFIYQFEDGDIIRGYVKKFDPEIGMTCMSLDTETRDWYKPSSGYSGYVEPDGTWCLMGFNLRQNASIEEILEALYEIKTTGRGVIPKEVVTGAVNCAFM